MKALARFGKAFGGYKMIDVPQPICGPEDVVIEIKAAAICGADMKHYNVDSGSDEFNSILAQSSVRRWPSSIDILCESGDISEQDRKSVV